LAPTPGSPFQPHLTAMDGGRGTKAPGDDTVKMAASPSLPVTVELLAMGEGGYLLIVRDLRALSSNPVGGASYTYQVMVAGQDPQFFQGQALTLANDQFDDSLSSPGAVKLYPFSATEGQNLKADLTAVSELDGRLFVFSVATGDWIARNDDRSAGDRNPLLDAPLFASGEMFLVVENIDETATALGYHLGVSSP